MRSQRYLRGWLLLVQRISLFSGPCLFSASDMFSAERSPRREHGGLPGRLRVRAFYPMQCPLTSPL